jgi:hypothetical protein
MSSFIYGGNGMTTTSDEMQTILNHTRRVVDRGDLLIDAVSSKSQEDIDEAVDSLIQAYEQYAQPLHLLDERFRFDEIVRQPNVTQRDQEAATALASILLDVEVANVLAQASIIAGEYQVTIPMADLDTALGELRGTIKTLDAPRGAYEDNGRFAFDQTSSAQNIPTDLDGLKTMFSEITQTLYARLQTETLGVVSAAFGEIDKLNLPVNSQPITDVEEVLNSIPPTQRLFYQAMRCLHRAISKIKTMIGPYALQEAEQWLTKTLDALRKGDGPIKLLLDEAYRPTQGFQEIKLSLDAFTGTTAQLARGIEVLMELDNHIRQAFSLSKNIVSSLRKITHLIRSIPVVRNLGLPFDLLNLGIFLLVIDISLLRGMDYADTTTIYKLVDGIRETAQHALHPHSP